MTTEEFHGHLMALLNSPKGPEVALAIAETALDGLGATEETVDDAISAWEEFGARVGDTEGMLAILACGFAAQHSANHLSDVDVLRRRATLIITCLNQIRPWIVEKFEEAKAEGRTPADELTLKAIGIDEAAPLPD